MMPFESLETLDAELAQLGRRSGVLRLGLANGLEALARIGGHHDLGFATVEAYALERCERSARWVQGSRALSRRLKELPAVRRALLAGRISFSMAQVVAKVADPENEELWLAEAQHRTVRAMRQLVKQQTEGRTEETSQLSAVDEEERVILTVTVDREDAWLLESARMIVQRVSGGTLEDTIDALLAEGTTTLLPTVDRASIVPFDDATDENAAQRAWERELARFREEAEIRCEAALAEQARAHAEAERPPAAGISPGSTPHPTASTIAAFDPECDGDAEHIDRTLRRISEELAQRDLCFGELAEVFWNADGWRRLRYATESQYARERLGMSLSSVKAKRALAKRARSLPVLGEALALRDLGYEAARLVAAVATPGTASAWVERARERTIKHLREEVDAAQMLCRLGIEPERRPPNDVTMEKIAAIESRIVTGAAFQDQSSQMSAPLADTTTGADSGAEERESTPAGRPAAGVRSLGRVTLKFRVGTSTARHFRWLERLFRRHGPRQISFVRFLCVALIDAWKHALGSDEAYTHVYARDCFRCTSPVCTRRDLTPHHLQFRSAGGDDSNENLTSLCVQCHLEGVHGGRIAVKPPASAMEWRIGRSAHTVVKGRQRWRASDRETSDRAV